MSEVALAGRRGFYSSFQYVTLIGGQLLASMVMLILQSLLDDAQLRSWGWRIPFAIGAVAAIVAFAIRGTLAETVSTETRARAEAGSVRALFAKHGRAFWTVVGFTAAGSLTFYTFTTYMQKYLVNTAGINDRVVNVVMTAVLFTYMIMQPLFGALSDRIGRRTSMLLFTGLATVFTLPIMRAIGNVHSPGAAFGLCVAALAIVSFYTSIGGIVKAELFPGEVRALGVGLSYAVANAAFGGTAEYVALWFKQAGREDWFYVYVSGLCFVALAVVAIALPTCRIYLQGRSTE